MMTRWEYLGVISETLTTQRADESWTFVTTCTVTTRGKTVACLRVTMPVDEPDEKYKPVPVGEQHVDYALTDDENIYDHLGGMGWEMVTGYVRSNVLKQNNAPGWYATFSSPFQEYFAFKRPLPD